MYGLLHDAGLFLVPLAVAYLMIVKGVRHNALEWRRSSRVCPSCGRPTSRCSCRD